ncbi:hypothetical protein [uncultured Psychroserpens sp.]|uniref:hypothetical protein n=1 Tax=uncultured Psychroserpens sp. TaxID=255436 RepID=UPI002614E04A|nr:hypothetical protein [uncultured Psychroserpens sp.]
METLYYLSSLCLIFFMVLATYDGFYLHIWKYELFNKKESLFEHKTHTIRAILFPLIICFLFINTVYPWSFYIGLSLVILDLITLGIDAYVENDSRAFMNGLPKWEYIIHLFSNSFHFAAIILIIATRISISDGALTLTYGLDPGFGKDVMQFIAINIIPGSIVLALIHLILILPQGKSLWNAHRLKITCC